MTTNRSKHFLPAQMMGGIVIGCVLALTLSAPVSAQNPQRLPQSRPAQPDLQQLRVERRLQEEAGPQITVEPLECLPLGENGVVAAQVRRQPATTHVRVYFRRVNPGHPEFYYVKAHAVDNEKQRALLPRPSDTGVRQEPVEYYAALFDHQGRELVRSTLSTAQVTTECPKSTPPVPGEGLNLTIGETTPFQGQAPPFHFECTGIVTREYSGRLFQDAVCREYFVPFVPRLQSAMLRSQAIGSALFRDVTIFYGTDRRRTENIRPAEVYLGDRGTLEVGTCVVTIPASHQVGELESAGTFERPDPEKHIILLTVTPQTEATFTTGLAARVAADEAHEVLVFIHGYNVSFEDAARRTAQMASDLEFKGAPVMYSWPSQASLGGYPVDEANIRWTVPHLQEFLQLIVERSGAAKVHLVAHSMGNRAITEVLLRYATAANLTPGASPQFNQVVLVAPDVDADVFKDEIAPKIRSVSDRISLYASNNDNALKVSKGVHGYPRAGDLSSGILITDGVETIDASNVDTSLLAAISLGHSYFAEQATVIADLKMLLEGLAPENRGLAERQDEGKTYWEVLSGEE